MTAQDSLTVESAGRSPSQRYMLIAAALLLAAAAGYTIYQLDTWREFARWIQPRRPPVTGVPVMQTNGRTGIPSVVDLSDSIIPEEKIFGGGPPKDGIPAVTDPKLIPASQARYLRPHDKVAGVEFEGEARAYPLKILTRHEAVNDRIGDRAIAVTYCPLCDSTAVFDRRTELGELNFGISGKLYNSNVLFYDRSRKESVWSQMLGKGIAGPGADKPLEYLPVEVTTWQAWKRRHPKTKVLDGRLGYGLDYNRDPYARYFAGPNLWFPVEPQDDRLPLKSPVLGVWTDGAAKAYPLAAFSGPDQPPTLEDEIDGVKLTLAYDPRAKSLRIVEAPPELRWVYAFWFAWYAFHPETEVYDGAE